jgi:SAM-dependent methyltransferase
MKPFTKMIAKDHASEHYEAVKSHYKSLLSEHYTWTFGGNEQKYILNKELLIRFLSEKGESRVIVDLGCGSGFQTIPLLQQGYQVFAIDGVDVMLNELSDSAQKLNCSRNLKIIESDMLLFQTYITEKAYAFVCMGESLTHLASLSEVYQLFCSVYDTLLPGGKFLIQFKDLTKRLYGTDRFLPVKSDDRTVFTCFLEWEDNECEEDGSGRLIKVTDLVHVKKGIGAWELCTSSYMKLGITRQTCTSFAKKAGFSVLSVPTEDGTIYLCLSKPMSIQTI